MKLGLELGLGLGLGYDACVYSQQLHCVLVV